MSQTAAERHRAVAGRFGECVRGVRDWDAPTPVEAWRARDVVRHLTEWSAGFLAGGAGIELPAGPGADVDPVTTWEVHEQAIQALLDTPASTDRTFRNPHTGDLPLTDAIDRFYTTDVLLHTWDLARASDQDDGLDPTVCAELLHGMEPMDAILRASGHYGPRVPVPDDADARTRLIAFIGRDPAWAAPRTGGPEDLRRSPDVGQR